MSQLPDTSGFSAVDRFAEISLKHYQSMETFEREQKDAIANVLDQIIEIVEFVPGPPYDEPLFKSFVSVPRLLDHIRAMKEAQS